MKMSKKNVGKTVYIVSVWDRKLLEGKIVSVEENTSGNTYDNEYTVITDAEDDSYNKHITLRHYNYKNSLSWSDYNFYFIKEQALRRLDELKDRESKIKRDRELASNSWRYLSFVDVKEKSRVVLMNMLLGRDSFDLNINQSQIKQINKYLDMLQEIVDNAGKLMFNFKSAFERATWISNDVEKINPINLSFTFMNKLQHNKLKQCSIFVVYETHGYRFQINIKKWKKFFTYE